jgi:D-methionine transport system permease protein
MNEQWIQFLEGLGFTKVESQLEFLLNPETIPFAIWETLYAPLAATILAYAIGLPLGVLLVTGSQDGIHPLPRWLMRGLNILVNLLRSVPFLILMVLVMPLSRMVLGTAIGTAATIVPLTVAAFPYIARLVEGSLREMDRGILEAAQSMGCSTLQIVMKVMLPECKPSLIGGAANACITILGYGAMAGSIGGGGLGAIALQRGYARNQLIVMYVAVILLVLLVQVLQTIGTKLATKTDKRITK